MGLDQYAYYRSSENPDTTEWINGEEFAYWRKHPNLHGWMQKLWIEKTGGGKEFNGIELELSCQDLERLEEAVKNKLLPTTTGFFFGNNSDDEYLDYDLTFIAFAKMYMFLGLKVFYNSSW